MWMITGKVWDVNQSDGGMWRSDGGWCENLMVGDVKILWWVMWRSDGGWCEDLMVETMLKHHKNNNEIRKWSGFGRENMNPHLFS